jgi:predicted phage terminase large subunit-like protein
MNNLKFTTPIFHEGQKTALRNKKRFNVLCCGRRFGKTYFDTQLIGTSAVIKQNQKIAYIAPTYKNLSEVWRELKELVYPFIKVKNESTKQIELINGSIIDFWSLENYETVRGRKYNLMILDEIALFKKLEQAWNEVLRATLIDFQGSAWFTSTPRNGFFKELADNCHHSPDTWNTVQLPTYSNPHIPTAEIELFKQQLPDLVYRQEILAEFVDFAGSVIKRSNIKYYDKLPDNLRIVAGVDLAITQKTTSDYTAMVTLGIDAEENIYIIDVERQRLTFREILQFIISKHQKFGQSSIAVETVAFQSVVADELLNNTKLPIFKITPKNDKILRFTPLWSKFEAGKVYLSKDLPNYFESELLQFPSGEHDDMIDALSYAYNDTAHVVNNLYVW